MSLEWCKRADVGLPKPDAVFLLKIGRDNLHQRPGFGEERYENDSFLNKVWANYQSLKDNTFKVAAIFSSNFSP
jgi:dTMP kinase